MTHKINIGDLITIGNHGVRVFVVNSVTHEEYADSEVQFKETYYDCTCVDTGEITLADSSTAYLIEDGDTAAEDEIAAVDLTIEEQRFISELAEDIADEVLASTADLERQMLGIVETAKAEAVDELLIELQDAITLREMFGDHEDDERRDRKYALRVCEIKAQLIEVTAGKPNGKEGE